MFKSSSSKNIWNNKVLIITDGIRDFSFVVYESLIKIKMDEQSIPMLEYPEYDVIKVDVIESKEYYPTGLSAEELDVLSQLYEKEDNSYNFIFDIDYSYKFKSIKTIQAYIDMIRSKLSPDGFYVSMVSNPIINELKVNVFGDYISQSKSNIVFFKKERKVIDVVREYSPVRSIPSLRGVALQRVPSSGRQRSPSKCTIL